MVQIKGIDVYQGDGPIDWAKVKADGVKFAFIKATEGTNYKYVDYFRNQAPRALGNGIDVGAYHYAKFSTVPEAICEAKYFVSVIKDFKLTYPAVLDLEENKQGVCKKQLTDAAIAFLEYLENAGYFAMLYTYDSFLDDQLEGCRLTSYAMWIARYGKQPKNHTDIWQWSETGKVNGITGDVDMNISYRDFAAEIAAMKKSRISADMKSAVPAYIGTVKVNISDGYLNVRDKPDISGNVVGKLYANDTTEYKAYEKRWGWYNVGLGWVSENYITFKPL